MISAGVEEDGAQLDGGEEPADADHDCVAADHGQDHGAGRSGPEDGGEWQREQERARPADLAHQERGEGGDHEPTGHHGQEGGADPKVRKHETTPDQKALQVFGQILGTVQN